MSSRPAAPLDKPPGARRDDRGFDLIRWFSLTALVSVATVSALAAWGLSVFLTGRMIRQEAEITAGFVRSIVATEHAYTYFDGAGGASGQQLADFLAHMTRMPDVLRTNVYSVDRLMVWSSDPALIGRRFDQNRELDEALKAELVINSGIVERERVPKSEHVDLDVRVDKFVESYIPILDEGGHHVVGVVELYKVPRGLFDAIAAGTRLVWGAAAAAGLFLYAALFWIVRRAQQTIVRQRQQLIESESLAMVGEMGSAVAHGLRNPLASIRSSAELALEHALPGEARICADDIISQVDRLEGWVCQLLTYAKPAHAHVEPVDINEVLRDTLAGYARDLERRDMRTRLELAGTLPAVRGEPALLGQLIGSLIANASEAMIAGGEIVLRSFADTARGGVGVEVIDNGPGMSNDNVGQVFKPFFTTKQKGLGLGLPLVQRVVERFGGSVEIVSSPGAGTTIRLHLLPYR